MYLHERLLICSFNFVFPVKTDNTVILAKTVLKLFQCYLGTRKKIYALKICIVFHMCNDYMKQFLINLHVCETLKRKTLTQNITSNIKYCL